MLRAVLAATIHIPEAARAGVRAEGEDVVLGGDSAAVIMLSAFALPPLDESSKRRIFAQNPLAQLEIANPIYDVVFKYLMEDNKVAKIFLSAVTGLDIISLEFLPQELVHCN